MRDVFDDPLHSQTYGRRLASYLSKFRFYNPLSRNADSSDEENDVSKPAKPDIDKGWEFFEHFVLPRCVDNKNKTGGKYNKVEPGSTEESKLYPIFGTPIADMGDFGIGVGMYYNTLRFLTIMCFLAGCINIPTMRYFSSNYKTESGNSFNSTVEKVKNFALKSSAMCSNVSWELCPSCTEDDWEKFPSTNDRIAKGANSGAFTYFIKKNECSINESYGIITITTLILFTVGMFYFMLTQKRRIDFYDKEELATPDYSIEITNPPKNDESSYDPEEWREWFEKTFDVDVAAVTIALDNEKLTQALIDRRKMMSIIQGRLRDSEEFDVDNIEEMIKLCDPVPRWKKFLCGTLSSEQIYANILSREVEIEKLSNIDYHVASVFVTFQTESQQQMVLNKLVTPLLRRDLLYDKKYAFKGKLLKVHEPPYPSAIRWQDLNTPGLKRFVLNTSTTLVSLAMIIGGAFVITSARYKSGAESAALVITLINQLTPRVVQLLTKYESHSDQTYFSASQYFKVTAFRWANTAIVTTVITPFTDTIQSGEYLIEWVYAMFLFDLWLTPVLQLSDIWGNICRHYFGPRANTQTKMNLNFKASTYDIGERYTNVTRILFFTLFYSSIFPFGFFLSSITFLMLIFLDKFSMLRSWSCGPKVGTRVVKISNIFFLLCIGTYAIMTAYNYLQFPFDNVCTSEELSTNYVGSWNVLFPDGTESTLEVDENSPVYNYCDQFLISKFNWSDLFQMKIQWLNDSQQKYGTLFGWTMLVVFVLVMIALVLNNLIRAIYNLFFYQFKVEKTSNHVRFSEVSEIKAYVPQVQVRGYVFPLLLCDVDGLKTEEIGWVDPYSKKDENPYDKHNIIFDVTSVAAQKAKERAIYINQVYAKNKDLSDIDLTQNEVEVTLNEDKPSVSDFIDRCCISHLHSTPQLDSIESIKFQNTTINVLENEKHHIFSIVKTFEDKQKKRNELKGDDSDESVSTQESSVGPDHRKEKEIMTWKTLVTNPF